MAMEFDDLPDDMGGGNRLDVPGTYHMMVERLDENPKYRGGDNKGQPSGGFELMLSVLAGPLIDRKFNLHVREPNISHKDGGAFARQIIKRVAVALGQMRPDQGGKLRIEPRSCEGRRVIVTLKKNDRDYLELHADRIWHIDDPSAPECVRDQEDMAFVAKEMPEHRLPAEAFGAGRGSNGAAPKQPAAQAASDLLDDL